MLITAIPHWLLGNEQKAGGWSSLARGGLSEEGRALPAVINWLFITLQEIKQWPQKERASNSNSRGEVGWGGVKERENQPPPRTRGGERHV